MSHITKLAVIETTNAIWEYDPSDPDNHVLDSGLDVITTIRTLAIKVNFLLVSLDFISNITYICRYRLWVNEFRNLNQSRLNAA